MKRHALAGEDPVIWILGGVFGGADAKARPLLHALEDEVHAVALGTHQRAQPALNVVLLAHALLGPLDGRVVIAGKGLDPVLILPGAPAEDLFVDHRNADHVTEEVHPCSGRDSPLR